MEVGDTEGKGKQGSLKNLHCKVEFLGGLDFSFLVERAGMNSVFSEQILADKLSKLNSTQQCIETLSHWCIFHRSKAEVVVATWNEQFHKSQVAQKVPLLYLANDILQNSKRKGNEFVTEFWKVLPAALKDLNENGDDQGKKVVSRLVNIWEERRVFGSRAQNLKDLMLGAQTLPPLEFSNKKRSRSVKIVRRDSRSIRTKLTIGGSAEKIVSAFHLVLSEQPTEDSEMSRCKSAITRVRKMEHDADIACAQAKDPKRKTLAKDLEEEENTLKECIQKLKSVEANRVALVTQLREALQEQESELENIRTQMQVAQAQAEEANNMIKRLCDENYVAQPAMQGGTNAGQKSKKTAADIAAEVADKLTASSSSQLIMTSVLSTFAAQEAKNAGLATSTSVSRSHPPMTPNTTSNVEQPSSVSDPNGFLPAQPAPTTPAHQYQSMIIQQPTLQTPSPSAKSQFQLLSNTASQQYAQASIGVTGFGYGSFPPIPPGPPPPPPAHVMSPMMPLAQTQLQMNQQQLLPLAPQSTPLMQQQPMLSMQQPPAPPSFRPLQPPGMMYFTQPHHNQ